MKPAYRLRKEKEDSNINLAAKPRQVEAWLSDLSGLEPSDKTSLLAAYLEAHDKADVAPVLRKQIAEILGSEIEAVVHGLRQLLRDIVFPIPPDLQETVAKTIHLSQIQVGFYKRLILDHDEQSRHFFGSDPFPDLVDGLLQAGARVLDICYITHSPVPDGLWHDLHQTAGLVYRGAFASGEGLAQDFIKSSERYVALLLEATSDPYHASDQERMWVRDVIARLGYLAQIEDGRLDGHKGVFGIILKEDVPPQPLSWKTARTKRSDLVLNTSHLVRKLASAISHLEMGKSGDTGLPNLRHPDYLASLSRLKLLWGGAMRRMTPRRTPASHASCTAMLGFQGVHDFLNSPSRESTVLCSAECEVVNESLNGASLKFRNLGTPLQIGTLVHVAQGETFRGLGLVRWFRQAADGALTLGLRLLQGHPTPVILLKGDGQESCPAILMLPAPGHPGVQSSLILPAMRLDPDASYEVQSGRQRFPVKLVSKSNRSSDVDIFRCTLDEEVSV